VDKVVQIQQFTPEQTEILDTLAEARAQALAEGATGVAVIILRQKDNLYASKTIASNNLQQSDIVGLLEIAKSDVIEHMRGR
jgi:predicted XRE-type DNA-binding protein